MERKIEEEFTCKSCGEMTKKSDYHENLAVYNSLKESGLCETCARLSEEHRTEYAMGKRIAEIMVKRRKEDLEGNIARLDDERKALDKLSPKEMALTILREKKLKEEQ